MIKRNIVENKFLAFIVIPVLFLQTLMLAMPPDTYTVVQYTRLVRWVALSTVFRQCGHSVPASLDPWENKNLTEGKTKAVSLLFGRRSLLECCTGALTARMIWRNVFGRKDIHFWRAVVCCAWCEPDLHSDKHPFFDSSFSSNRPGAKSLVVPPTSSDDLCLCFCEILIQCWAPTSFIIRWIQCVRSRTIWSGFHFFIDANPNFNYYYFLKN